MACSKTDKPSFLPMVRQAAIQHERVSNGDSSSSNERMVSLKRNVYVKRLKNGVEGGMRMVENEIGMTRTVARKVSGEMQHAMAA